MHIDLLEQKATGALVDHLVRNALESGRDGDSLARARSADDPPDRASMHERLGSGWARAVGDAGWERAFGLWADHVLIGHVDLRGGTLPTDQHRATLGIGIERPWRRAGWGQKLMQTASAWAHDQGLTWIDLGVFAENAPARTLYTSLGYVEIGRTVDRFRIDGRQVDDISMVLRLR
jgi:ribosomal protein S18 acetylase RimI-like enzyme